jgi:hypothetical protein
LRPFPRRDAAIDAPWPHDSRSSGFAKAAKAELAYQHGKEDGEDKEPDSRQAGPD